MQIRRAPRHVQAPDPVPSTDGRRLLYAQALQASAQLNQAQGFVALVLLEVLPAGASPPDDEHVLEAVTTRLAELINRRLRSVDLLIRSASCELAVLLTLAHIGVATAFSERLRQPIEQALREMDMDHRVAVCMGLAANPQAAPWHPDELIELADFRLAAARHRSAEVGEREWALVVECAALPPTWRDTAEWPVSTYITNDSGF